MLRCERHWRRIGQQLRFPWFPHTTFQESRFTRFFFADPLHPGEIIFAFSMVVVSLYREPQKPLPPLSLSHPLGRQSYTHCAVGPEPNVCVASCLQGLEAQTLSAPVPIAPTAPRSEAQCQCHRSAVPGCVRAAVDLIQSNGLFIIVTSLASGTSSPSPTHDHPS